MPLQALQAEGGATHAWLFDPSTQSVQRTRVKVVNVAGNEIVISEGLKAGDIVVTAGVHLLKEGQKVRLLSEATSWHPRLPQSSPSRRRGAEPMSPSRLNLSAWAIDHAPLLRYLMVVLLLGGVFAFTSLGQDEDPPFTFRVMVVRAYWPGATATQMAEQVTDKFEKKLQETPGIDKIRSYSKPGEALIFVQVNEAMRGRAVADAWYQVRKKVGDIRATLPPNVQGPFFNDEFGDVYGVIFAFSTDGFNYRDSRTTSRACVSSC